MHSRKTGKHWAEWFPILVLLGILAGALGGVAVGLITSRTSSSITSTTQ